MPNLDVALRYAAAGMPVFPCGADKRPLVSSWPADATTDESKVRAWWTAQPAALVGLPLEPLDLVVFDGDRHGDGKDGVAHFNSLSNGLPPHPTVLTANNGEHHYFRQPPSEKIRNKQIGNGLETRGCGGYVVAAGSRLPDGRAWRLANGSASVVGAYKADSFPAVPAHLAELVRPRTGANHQQRQSTGNAGPREKAYAAAALDNLARDLAGMAPESGRNNALNVAALKMGGMVAVDWIGRATTEGRLFDACLSNGLVKDTRVNAVQATVKSGLEAGLKSPHEPLPLRDDEPHKQSEAKATIHDWDDPDWSILDDRRGILPEFPLHALSAPFGGWVERAAKGAGVTAAHVAAPAIGIASSLIGMARRVRATSSWIEPATCWVAIVGYSGSGKTPGIGPSKVALNDIERNSRDKIEQLQRAHETRVEKAKAARAKWKKQVEESVEAAKPEPTMPADAMDPGKFIAPKLYVSDPTIERLGELLTARPQGMLRLSDELSGMFANMSRYSGGQDNEFWLEAWNGNSFSVERVGRNLLIDHLLVGVVGGMQPDKIAKSFEGPADGMYARILFCWPEEAPYSELSDNALEVDPAIVNALHRLNGLVELEDGRLVKRDLPLSTEARQGFEQFRQFVHQLKATLEGREREWLAKAPAHVLRLTDTLCLLNWAIGDHPAQLPASIAPHHMVNAIKLVRDYFWPHARAVLRQIGLTDRHIDARRTLRWIRTNAKRDISVKDIRRDALGGRLDEDQTKALLDGLERAGWLSKSVTPSGPRGGKPVMRWIVNPALFTNPTAETAETAQT